MAIQDAKHHRDPPISTAPGSHSDPSTPPSPKKRKKSSSKKPGTLIAQFPLRHPTWTYIHLQRIPSSPSSPSSSSPLDPVTIHLHLTAALTQFLGTHGSAIPFDILNVQGQDVWVRVPAEDRGAVIAAVGGWIQASNGDGWKVRGWSCWNAMVSEGRDGGQGLFED